MNSISIWLYEFPLLVLHNSTLADENEAPRTYTFFPPLLLLFVFSLIERGRSNEKQTHLNCVFSSVRDVELVRYCLLFSYYLFRISENRKKRRAIAMTSVTRKMQSLRFIWIIVVVVGVVGDRYRRCRRPP